MPPLVVKNIKDLHEYVGREIGVSEWLLISQERVTQFAEVTEDRQWIHLDATRAAVESPYSVTIAHGFLTLSLVSHFMKEVIAIEGGLRFVVNYGLNRVRFPAPVKVASRIRGRVALTVLMETADSVDATFAVTIESEASSKPNCVAEWIVRYYL